MRTFHVRVLVPAIIAIVILFTMLLAAKEKDKDQSEKTVDSGAFGVFKSAQRVGTETFSIKQGTQGATVASEFKSEVGEQKAEQSSWLELTPAMDLRQYSWKEIVPEKVEATVAPNDTFLIEHFTTGANDKQHEQNFLLPPSTSILDDYFFVHREVLAWKYLHTACREEKGVFGCPLHQRVEFGTLNPHARSSAPVSIEFAGKDKVSIRGKDQDLLHFILRAETGDWAFWLDDQFKLVRMMADGGVEVLRD